MRFNKRLFSISILVFIISFLWMFSLTYNFNYFWEDSAYLDKYQQYLQNTGEFSPKNLTNQFFKTLTEPSQFYNAGYGDRPLLFFSFNVLIPIQATISDVSWKDASFYRALESLLYACFICLVFCFFYRIGEQDKYNKDDPFFQKLIKNDKMVMLFLLLGYMLVIPEMWLNVTYGISELLLSQFFATVPLVIFLFYYNDPSLKNRVVLSILFFVIVFFTHISILIKHVGRINFLLIFMFLLFTDRKKIFTWRYGSLIVVLLFLSFPLIGLFITSPGGGLINFVGTSSVMGAESGSGIFSTLFEFLTTFHLSFFPQAFFILLLFFLFFVFHLYGYFKKKKYKDSSYTLSLKNFIIFSLFWYLLAAISLFMARGFVFDPRLFTRYEFSIFLVPQALFLVSYAQFVYKKYFSAKKFMQYIIFIFIILAIFHNVGRLNGWRGGWGSYFLGFDTVRQYVDYHEENAIVLTKPYHATSFHFTSTNNYGVVRDITNSSLLRLYQKNYTSVFIAEREKLTFDNPDIVNVTELTIIDNSPYGKFKKLIGRYYPNPMYLYIVQKE